MNTDERQSSDRTDIGMDLDITLLLDELAKLNIRLVPRDDGAYDIAVIVDGGYSYEDAEDMPEYWRALVDRLLKAIDADPYSGWTLPAPLGSGGGSP